MLVVRKRPVVSNKMLQHTKEIWVVSLIATSSIHLSKTTAVHAEQKDYSVASVIQFVPRDRSDSGNILRPES
jgi:hypothetical protein